MFYRRKIILALLKLFGGELKRTDFQKYLFLFVRMQEKPSFDFVPYKFGCFSFQSLADKEALEKLGLLCKTEEWKLSNEENYFLLLTEKDKNALLELKENFGYLSGMELVRFVYKKYPYFAVKSEIKNKVLSASELQAIVSQTPKNEESCLFTIGYEGKSFDFYLNELVEKNIKLLCDVRKNPFSMKYGFSKNQLSQAVEKLEIKYFHVPELGIEAKERQNLNTVSDYEKLFKNYVSETLPQKTESLKLVFDLILEHRRVALTCFESCYTNCHRNKIVEKLQTFPEFDFKVEHL
ncbi:DUF488 family protein [bacterium]|nr:DUF488 family protein [bacterium]